MSFRNLNLRLRSFSLSSFSMLPFKEAGIVLAIIAVMFFVFIRNVPRSFFFFLAFFLAIYIPGYALALMLLKDWGDMERSIIAIFLGMGPTPILAYILSNLGVNAVSPIFVAVIALLSLAAIVLIVETEKTEEKTE